MSVSNLKELKQKAKLPARQAGGGTVQAFFKANKSSMAAVLPKHVTPERMLRIAMGALRTTPALMDATVESLMGAVMVCAQVGLEPNTPMGHAYLIPFKNKKARRTDVQIIFGYRGLIDLARRSGQIVSLMAQVVYENDHFDFAYGLTERLEHIPAESNRGAFKAVYAVAQLQGGGYQFEVMYRDAVVQVMQNTQSRGKYGPWKEHFDEMARKTAIRRLYKYLPVSIEIAQAAQIDEVAEAGGDQHLHTVLDGDYQITNEDYKKPDEDQDEMQDDATPGEPESSELKPGYVSVGDSVYPESFESEGQIAWVDVSGEFFDSKQHQWKNDMPVINKDGSFRKLPGKSNA